MAQIINITCHECKKDFTIEPYYCNTDIYTQEDPKTGSRYYIARTVAMAICPHCGETNGQVCENDIYKQDIIDLAIRRYKRG
jgi:hypothetical protein